MTFMEREMTFNELQPEICVPEPSEEIITKLQNKHFYQSVSLKPNPLVLKEDNTLSKSITKQTTFNSSSTAFEQSILLRKQFILE